MHISCTPCSNVMSAIISPTSPRSDRAFADYHHHEMRSMLKALRDHPLLAGMAEVLAAAARYVAVMLFVLLLLRQLARIAL